MINNRVVLGALAGAMILCAASVSAQDYGELAAKKKKKGLTLKTPIVSPKGSLAAGSALTVRVQAIAKGGKVTSVTAYATLLNGSGATRTVTLVPAGGNFFQTGTDRVLVPSNTKTTSVKGYVVVRAVSTVGTKSAKVKITIGGNSGDTGQPPPPPPI